MSTLSEISTKAPKEFDKQETKELTVKLLKELNELQNLLYAESKHSVLIILQGMDASGKDGVILLHRRAPHLLRKDDGETLSDHLLRGEAIERAIGGVDLPSGSERAIASEVASQTARKRSSLSRSADSIACRSTSTAG